MRLSIPLWNAKQSNGNLNKTQTYFRTYFVWKWNYSLVALYFAAIPLWAGAFTVKKTTKYKTPLSSPNCFSFSSVWMQMRDGMALLRNMAIGHGKLRDLMGDWMSIGALERKAAMSFYVTHKPNIYILLHISIYYDLMLFTLKYLSNSVFPEEKRTWMIHMWAKENPNGILFCM